MQPAMQTGVYGNRIYRFVNANFEFIQNFPCAVRSCRALRNNMMHFIISSIIGRFLYFGKTVRKLLFYLLRYVAD